MERSDHGEDLHDVHVSDVSNAHEERHASPPCYADFCLIYLWHSTFTGEVWETCLLRCAAVLTT